MIKFLQLLKKTFPRFVMATFITEIEKHIKDCKSIIDVGCGNNSPLQYLTKNRTMIGVDDFSKALEESKNKHIHSRYYKLDVRNLSKKFKGGSFDAAIALDVVEHLKKKDGYKLLREMERVARKKVILVTPNGFIPQFDKKNKLQEHLSGWSVEDFQKKGYKVEGIYGFKFCNIFRTEEAELRWRPRIFWALVWGILVEITHHLYTKRLPEHSISLLAVKDLSEDD